MVSSFLALTLGAMPVLGQVPDLREGDCVRALDDIDYEHMPNVKRGFRGMVTGKGILWEGRNWQFELQDKTQKYLFKERNAIIHRSMVEKMPESEGYGTIELPPRAKAGDWQAPMGGPQYSPTSSDIWIEQRRLCLTVFEVENTRDRPANAPLLQWWECEPGWAAQMFIYPACGFGPGQFRWAADPQLCVFREPSGDNRLMLGKCDWVQKFIFWNRPDKYYDDDTTNNVDPHSDGPGANNAPQNPGACDPVDPDQCCSNQDPCDGTSRGKARIYGALKVGAMDTNPATTPSSGGIDDPDRKDDLPEEFEISNPPYFFGPTIPNPDLQDANTGFWKVGGKTMSSGSGSSSWDPPCDTVTCGPPSQQAGLSAARNFFPLEFKGLWQSTDLDV